MLMLVDLGDTADAMSHIYLYLSSTARALFETVSKSGLRDCIKAAK